MSERNLYEILGVDRNASSAEIKKAYKRLAMKYHPDRSSGDKQSEDKFKEANNAYEILSNDSKRAAYDQFGHAGVNNSGHGGFSGGGNDFGAFSDIFGSAFGDLFNGGSSSRADNSRSHGADLLYKLDLDLEEALNGTAVTINVDIKELCPSCHGDGTERGHKPQTCSTCHGSGKTTYQQGFIAIQRMCTICNGKGSVITHPCSRCNGPGIVREKKKLSVNIPAGVDTGDRMCLKGKGNAGGYGARPGDLYIDVNVRQHHIFIRKDYDLYCNVHICFPDAVLGIEVEVPTLSGRIALKLPSGTQNNKLFRVRGRGVKNARTKNTGDLFCKVLVETPINLDNSQKQLIKKLQKTLQNKKHSPLNASWLDSIKTFFKNLK